MLFSALLVCNCAMVYVQASLDFLRSDLEALRNDFPPSLSGFVDHQEVQLETIAMGIDFISQVDRIVPPKEIFISRNKTSKKQAVSVPVYVDVVLIGFEASSLDLINDKWLQKLNSESVVQATIGKQTETVSENGPSLAFNFRLVHVSFHVQTALRLFIRRHINRISMAIGSGHYVSAHEMEPVLEDLARSIYGPKGPTDVSATLFVLNHLGKDDDTWHSDYGYKSGYSTADLAEMASNRLVMDECFKIIAPLKALTKVDLEASNIPVAVTDDSTEAADREAVLDAVPATRLWALALREKLKSEPDKSVTDRALSILTETHAKDSPGFWRQLSLARDIIDVFSGTVVDNGPEEPPHCTSKSWFTRGRIVWSDLSADGAKPLSSVLLTGKSYSSYPMLSFPISMDTGAHDHEIIVDFERADNSIQAGTRLLFSYFKQLKSVASQLKCDLGIIDEDSEPASLDITNPAWKRSLKRVGTAIVSDLARVPSVCSHLLMRVGFVKHMLSAQEELRVSLSTIDKQLDFSGETYINDIVLFEKRIQAEILHVIQADLVHHDNEEHSARSYTFLQNEDAKLAVAPPLVLSSYEMNAASLASIPAESLFNAYHGTFSLLSEASGFLKSPQSVEMLSLFELTESYSTLDYKNSVKMNNTLLRNENRKSGVVFDGALLSLYVPEKIEIIVFFLVLQEAYKPVGADGIDASVLLSDLQRLRLSNQRMAVTVHTGDVQGEDRLKRGLLACRRSTHKSDGHSPNHVYLDPKCLWEHIKDEEETKRNMARSKLLQRLPIFIFSVDFPSPLYLGTDYEVSVSLGEAVLAIQNSQREVPTGFFCGGAPVFFPGRNPLSPLLMSVASSIVGLALTNPLKQYTSANSIHFCGQSPVFSGVDVSRPSFSVLDMDAANRNRFLRSIASSEWIVRLKWESTLLSSHEWAQHVNRYNGEQDEVVLLEKYHARYEEFIPHELVKLKQESLQYVRQLDWVRASRTCNLYLSASLQLSADFLNYTLFVDENADSFSAYKKIEAEKRARNLLLRITKRNVVAALGQFVVPLICATMSYFAAGVIWKSSVAIDSGYRRK